MADKPCKECLYYDPINIKNNRTARHGRCGLKSVYPAVEQSGQSFPANAKRAEPGQPAKPVIVVADEVVKGCDEFRARGKR